jgi:hypothetical protein
MSKSDDARDLVLNEIRRAIQELGFNGALLMDDQRGIGERLVMAADRIADALEQLARLAEEKHLEP